MLHLLQQDVPAVAKDTKPDTTLTQDTKPDTTLPAQSSKASSSLPTDSAQETGTQPKLEQATSLANTVGQQDSSAVPKAATTGSSLQQDGKCQHRHMLTATNFSLAFKLHYAAASCVSVPEQCIRHFSCGLAVKMLLLLHVWTGNAQPNLDVWFYCCSTVSAKVASFNKTALLPFFCCTPQVTLPLLQPV